MIDRSDMLELTRRMTPARTSFTRIAGCYLDREGEIDGTFNTNFLKLSGTDKEKNLLLAKAIPFSKANVQLKEHVFCREAHQRGGIVQLLDAIRSCGLKNDALMEIFYEYIAKKYTPGREYAIFVFHDRYDVPVKGMDKERQWESEEVYEYLICAICPLKGEYEPDTPECGFLYPSFANRSCYADHIAIFHRNPDSLHRELEDILGCT